MAATISSAQTLHEFAAGLSTSKTRTYPSNLVQTHKSRHALRTYQERLGDNGTVNFVKDGKHWSIFLWDLEDNGHEYCLHPKISTMAGLVDAMKPTSVDPQCRFIFIQTARSRGPLCCSLDQLVYIMTYYRVMPSFLDFVFEFRKRGDSPEKTNRFRLDDNLSEQNRQWALAGLGRSGLRIQHSFNLMGYELDEKSEWQLRHTTALHSFDIEQGRALWIVIKGDKVMRDRITCTPEVDEAQGRSVQASFGAALKTHLVIAEWANENWSRYIEHFEEKTRKYSSATKHAPVMDLAAAASSVTSARAKGVAVAGSHHQSPPRSGTGFSRVLSNLSKLTRVNTRPPDNLAELVEDNMSQDAHDDSKEKNVTNFDQIFNFEDQQKIHALTELLETAILVVDEDLKILAELKNRYSILADTDDHFKQFRLEISGFVQQIGVIEGDMGTQQARLRALLHRLDKNEEMYKRALEYRNMVVGVEYALSAQKSARTMEDLSRKMHRIAEETQQKTVSMHVITILGLIFLPGTLVATVMSSGIVEFGGEGRGTGFGDWEFRAPALMLFLVLCLPLMAITVPIWWVTYWGAQLRQR